MGANTTNYRLYLPLLAFPLANRCMIEGAKALDLWLCTCSGWQAREQRTFPLFEGALGEVPGHADSVATAPVVSSVRDEQGEATDCVYAVLHSSPATGSMAIKPPPSMMR